MGAKELVDSIGKVVIPLQELGSEIVRSVDGAVKATSDFANGGLMVTRDVVVDGERIVSKTESDLMSTAQFALFGAGVLGLLFVANTSGDKLADVVIVPSKTISNIAKKI